MKAIDIKQAHIVARNSKCDDFVQAIKVSLTGEPVTAVIDCDPVIVDKNELKKLFKLQKELSEKINDLV